MREAKKYDSQYVYIKIYALPTRAMTDAGAEANIITNTAKIKLELSYIPRNTNLNTINSRPTLVCGIFHVEDNTPFSM